MRFVLLFCFFISMLTFASAACNIPREEFPRNSLFVKIGGKFKPYEGRKLSGLKKEFGVWSPMRRSSARMYLVKSTHVDSDGKDRSVPDIVVSRTASKVWARDYLFRLRKKMLNKLSRSKVDATLYHLVNRFPHAYPLRGSLAKFHQDFAVGNMNAKTLRRKVRSQATFAFRDVVFKSPNIKRSTALKLVRVFERVAKVVNADEAINYAARSVGLNRNNAPRTSAKVDIKKLRASLHYISDGGKPAGYNVCFKVRRHKDADRTKLEVYHLHDGKTRSAERLINRRVNWIN